MILDAIGLTLRLAGTTTLLLLLICLPLEIGRASCRERV